MTDRRRSLYVPISVMIAHGKTGRGLLARFGRDGLLVWMLYLAACKVNYPTQGRFTYTSEPDGWAKLGLEGYVPEFTLEQFFKATGQLKQTSKRRSGDVSDIVCTNWGAWNDAWRREREAEQKASKRTGNTPPLDGQSSDDPPTIDRLRVRETERGTETVREGARKPADDLPSEVREELAAIGFRASQVEDAAQLDAGLIRAWLEASRAPHIRSRGAYVAKGLASQEWPRSVESAPPPPSPQELHDQALARARRQILNPLGGYFYEFSTGEDVDERVRWHARNVGFGGTTFTEAEIAAVVEEWRDAYKEYRARVAAQVAEGLAA
jgi:hypothetical protein